MGEYKYWVMPGNTSLYPDFSEKNKDLFTTWKKIWSETLGAESRAALDINQFLRQDFACGLIEKNQIVGLHLYSLFNIEHPITKECDYFSQISDDLVKYLENHNIKTLMSMEYLAVDEKYRGAKSHLHVPSLIIGLGIKLMSELSVDSIVGTVRAGAPGVEKVCHSIGATLLDTTIYRYNIPHKFFIAKKDNIKLPGDKVTTEAIESIWKERISFIKQKTNSHNKRAA